MGSKIVTWTFLLGVFLQPSNTQVTVPGSVLNCCEGDVLILLDSSGSVSSYEFKRLLQFLSELLSPFRLGRGHVRLALLQVGTEPRLEFGLDSHTRQQDLQGALLETEQLQGDTNTHLALQLAQRLLARQKGEEGLPKVLVWLTDGVEPGAVDEPMARLRQEGVSVLGVSTGHGNYHLLRSVVSPPIDAHLYFVDVDDIGIITEDLRDAIIELIRAEQLLVRDVTARSAVLQWRPVLSGGLGHYVLHYGADGFGAGQDQHSTSFTTSRGQYQRLILPGNSSRTELKELQPDTPYTVRLTRAHSNMGFIKPLSTTFRTLPEILSPVSVTISESGANSVRVSWGPLQPEAVERYRIEYGPIPRGEVRTATLPGYQGTTLLTRLQPDTQYLVTISALHFSGQEKAMSVKACTQAVLPALADLQLTPVGKDSVQVQWQGQGEGLRGYWVNWEERQGSSSSSSLYLPPNSLSTLLTHVSPATRVCVSPVYQTARGPGLCCTTTTGL